MFISNHFYLEVILLASIAIVIRVLSNPISNVYQKRLSKNGHHPLFINFLSYLGLSTINVLVAFNVSWPLVTPKFWIYSTLVGITGACGNGFLVNALQKGELSVLGPINAYKSVVGLVIGVILLNELPNFWGVLGTMFIIGGSYFVLNTTEEKFSWLLLKRKEIQFRIWAMILTAIEAVFLKKVILASNVTVAFFSWCWFGTVFSFILLLINKINVVVEVKQTTKNDLGKYLVLIFCIGSMQLTTNYVFAQMAVGYALALFQLSVIVSVFFGYRFFNEQNMKKKLIGSVIMLVGSVLIILLK